MDLRSLVEEEEIKLRSIAAIIRILSMAIKGIIASLGIA